MKCVVVCMLLKNIRTSQLEDIGIVKGQKVCLVGSSGVLVGKELGGDIDKYECVVRMNSACIGGFEKDVGGSCNYRVVAYKSLLDGKDNDFFRVLGRLGLSADCKLLFWGPRNHVVQVQRKLMILAQEFPNVAMYDIGEDFLKGCDNVYTRFTGAPRFESGAWISTGWITLCLFLGEGCEVDVFGLTGGGKDLYHYWDSSRGREGIHYGEQQLGVKGHRFITEHKIFKEVWPKMFKLRFLL